MAVNVSKIPNNNKFDPVREAILDLQGQLDDTGGSIGNGTLTVSTSGTLTGSGTFTANQSDNTTITIGIDDSTYLTSADISDFITLTDLSVTTSATPSGGGALSYDDTTGVFTFTPADAGTGLTLQQVTANGNTTTYGISTGNISVQPAGTGNGVVAISANSVGNASVTLTPGSTAGDGVISTTIERAISFRPFNTEKVVIASDGNMNIYEKLAVGKTTAASTYHLEVDGTALANNFITSMTASGTTYTGTVSQYYNALQIRTVTGGTISLGGSGPLSVQNNVAIKDGDLDVNGDVTADFFIGDGSQLTNIAGANQNLQDVTDNGATTTNYITSSANTSGQTYGNFTASGTEDWYMFALGSRGASAGAYGIGLKNNIADRTLSFHIPNHAAYSSSGSIPKFGFYSNGAVELFTVKSDSGDSYVRGELEVGGRGIFNSDAGENNRVLTLKDLAAGTGNIVQYTKSDGTNLWEIVGRENGFYIYNNMISTMAIHINETNNNVGIGGPIDQAHRVSIQGTNDYLINLNNTSTDPRLQFQRSGTSQAHISSGGGLLTLYGASGTNTDIRFMPRGVTTGYINPSGLGIKTTDPEAGVDINIGTSTAQANWSSGTIPYGTEKADLVLTRRHSVTKDGNLGYAGALIDFRATNSANEWSTAQIISTIDPNGGSNHSGGLHFLTSGGGTTDAAGRRNAGAAPAVRMSIDTQGRVGIGRYNPSYKLDIGGTLRIGAATNSIYFDADGIYTAMYADGVLRIKQRVEVWGEGTAGRQYLDVRDTDGSVKVKLDGESTSYFTRNVAIGATSIPSGGGALFISGTGGGAALDWANTTATTGRSFRWVSLNSGGFAVEDLTAGGANRFNIDPVGNTGIGTDSPTALTSNAFSLSLGGTNATTSGGLFHQVNGVYKGYQYVNTTNGFNWNTIGVQYRWSIDGSERMVLGTDGTLNLNSYLSVNSSTGITSSGWIHLHRYSSNLNVSVGNNGSNINLFVPNGYLTVGTSDSQGFKARVAGNFKADTNIETPQIYGSGSSLQLGNFTTSNADEWPKLFWLRNTGAGWDEGLIKGNSTRGVFGKEHFGIHFDDDRSFAFHTSGWDTEMEIRGDGLTYMKGQVMIGRTSEVSSVKLAVENAAWFDSNSASRVLYLEGGAENGNIVQFQRYGVNKWELVGRDGTFYIYKNDGTGSGMKYQINTSGEHTITGVVTTTSTLRAQGDVIAYYSDMRLKTKIGDIQDPIGKLQSLNGFYYEPNEIAQSYGYEVERRIGLSAQEVKEVVPEAVHDAPIGDGYMAVDYAKLVPVLVEAIKEQQKQIDELKARLDA